MEPKKYQVCAWLRKWPAAACPWLVVSCGCRRRPALCCAGVPALPGQEPGIYPEVCRHHQAAGGGRAVHRRSPATRGRLVRGAAGAAGWAALWSGRCGAHRRATVLGAILAACQPSAAAGHPRAQPGAVIDKCCAARLPAAGEAAGGGLPTMPVWAGSRPYLTGRFLMNASQRQGVDCRESAEVLESYPPSLQETICKRGVC